MGRHQFAGITHRMTCNDEVIHITDRLRPGLHGHRKALELHVGATAQLAHRVLHEDVPVELEMVMENFEIMELFVQSQRLHGNVPHA